MCLPRGVMRIASMLCTTNTIEALRFRRDSADSSLSTRRVFTFLRWNFFGRARCCADRARLASATGVSMVFDLASGESQLRVLPNERAPARDAGGTPLPDSKAEQPPVIRRAELVAFALVALLVICVVAVLYAAKAFFLPVVSAFVVGTMLSPAAGFLERRRIPRAVSAVLIVSRGRRRRRLHGRH